MTPNVYRDDGVTHINVWSRGRTALGTMLSNFSHFPFDHPEHGFFASVEAYWYWVAGGGPTGNPAVNHLRRLYGASAKSAGSRIPSIPMEESEFQNLIRQAVRLKVEQNPSLAYALRESTLPFDHYFAVGRELEIIVRKDKHRWQLDWLAAIRRALKGEIEWTALESDGEVLLATGELKNVTELTQDDVVQPTSAIDETDPG